MGVNRLYFTNISLTLMWIIPDDTTSFFCFLLHLTFSFFINLNKCFTYSDRYKMKKCQEKVSRLKQNASIYRFYGFFLFLTMYLTSFKPSVVWLIFSVVIWNSTWRVLLSFPSLPFPPKGISCWFPPELL